MLLTDAARLRRWLEGPSPPEELSAVHGTACLVVDLGGTELGRVEEVMLALPCVTIGRHDGSPPPGARGFDVLLGPDEADLLEPLVAAVEAHPLAAAALAVLLRGAERRTIEDGLAAESAVYSLLQAGPEFGAWRAEHPARSLAPEPGPAVIVERDERTLRVTLNRPRRHNAFSRRVRDELTDALTLAVADPTVERVVVDGAGPSFCSGGDLDEFGSFPDPATAHAIRLTRSPARLMAFVAARTEVRLHGACMGAGIELPAFAGRIVADPGTVIALPELSLGLIPGAGGTASLPRRIGRERTALLALSGMHLDAHTALAWGLVDRVEPVAGRTGA
jgi:enoyl-CoA hydratase/carnithine racemase